MSEAKQLQRLADAIELLAELEVGFPDKRFGLHRAKVALIHFRETLMNEAEDDAWREHETD